MVFIRQEGAIPNPGTRTKETRRHASLSVLSLPRVLRQSSTLVLLLVNRPQRPPCPPLSLLSTLSRSATHQNPYQSDTRGRVLG